MSAFDKEIDFEDALVAVLKTKGWNGIDGIHGAELKYSSEKDLIDNWAQILYQNNREKTRLDRYPLTVSEMDQILEQVRSCTTPIMANAFINGGYITIIRDNPDDVEHLGREVSLKIYDRLEIAAGKSCYQIVRQPIFRRKDPVRQDRRGDVCLLINGMPVIHIELKKTGVSVEEAYAQIENYSREGAFTGLFSLIQIFVAMVPEETVYFANPGNDGRFNRDYYFHWADFNNEPVNCWKNIAESLLSIPMAHQMIGFYTVSDGSDGVLKVMRSYQYFAVNMISDKVHRHKWHQAILSVEDRKKGLGGYVWHTTGSGKTMTSFKAAQLIALSKDADRVVFLVDRIELGTQSLREYRCFAGADLTEAERRNTVQETEDTGALLSKLSDDDVSNILIVTSIQKMSNINDEAAKWSDAIEKIGRKRIVFIVDECHRSTFGDMLAVIKKTFPHALFFGFTGTPIQEENEKRLSTTSDIFGPELHRYSIADGIRDKNVLGFDPTKVMTFKENDLRRAVALDKAKVSSEAEALQDEDKRKIYLRYMKDLEMADSTDEQGNVVYGVEHYLKTSQYHSPEHHRMVMEDILENWTCMSVGAKFHAILATASIQEAVEYYRLFKERKSPLKITALFDPNVDLSAIADDPERGFDKKDGLEEIVADYNQTYGMSFSVASFPTMKKDISARLAHKKPYTHIETEPEKAIDLLIVVDQMLTGFDSKWINTLYLDKIIEYENIIQAFSRTNRLFGPEKPFGSVKYYRKPCTMERNIERALKLYSGNQQLSLFAEKLASNLAKVNDYFSIIRDIFRTSGIPDFSRIPDQRNERKEFAINFIALTEHLEASKIQGFVWEQKEYKFSDPAVVITVELDKLTYEILSLRYLELTSGGGGERDGDDLPGEAFVLTGHLQSVGTGKIDSSYMNSRFEKYIKELHSGDPEIREALLTELHRTFATLSQEDQRHAQSFLNDVQSGEVKLEPGKTFSDYVAEYGRKASDDLISFIANAYGLDEVLLREMKLLPITSDNLDEYGRFTRLRESVDKVRARDFIQNVTGETLTTTKALVKMTRSLRDYILNDHFEYDNRDRDCGHGRS